jgi:hypothetical protein
VELLRYRGIVVFSFCAVAMLSASPPARGQDCTPAATVGCFLDGRVQAELDWTNDPPTALAPPRWPAQGSGTFHDLGIDDFALISFADPETPDMMMSMIDATVFDGHFWLFASAVTDVGFTLQLTRTSDGKIATYSHPIGQVGSMIADTSVAFLPPIAAGAASALVAEAAALCAPNALCLHDGRFEVTVEWRNHHASPEQTGVGHPLPFSQTTGLFGFFTTHRAELMVNVIDGRARNDHFWVRVASLTDVEWTLEVRDTKTGAIWSYRNPAGSTLPHVDPTAIAAPLILEVPALGGVGEILLVVLLLSAGIVSLRRRSALVR